MAESEARELRLVDPEADRRMVETPELWRYLPQLLAYPLRGYALYVVFVMGFLMWLAGYAGPFGIALNGVIFGWMGYYFMEVVLRTAVGHATPPPMGTDVLFMGDKLKFGMLLAYIGGIVLAVLSASRAHQGTLAIVLFCLGVYLLPAYLAALVLQPSPLAALNPLVLLRFLWYTGLAYVFAALLLAAVGVLMVVLSGKSSNLVSSILLVYGIIFLCHLVGYVAYHHHEELDIAVSVARPTEESRAGEEQALRLGNLLQHVDRQLEAKDPRAARDAILAESGADLLNPRGFHEDLFEALRQRRQDALSLVQGNRLLGLLVQQKRLGRALDIAEICLDLSPRFLPQPPMLAAVLAEQALTDKRLALFTRLDAAVQQAAPGSEAAAALQFLRARALVEQRQDGEALKLLAPLAGMSSHPWHARMAALHKALAGLKPS